MEQILKEDLQFINDTGNTVAELTAQGYFYCEEVRVGDNANSTNPVTFGYFAGGFIDVGVHKRPANRLRVKT